MTTPQAKVLAFIRKRGVVLGTQLTAYQFRSVFPLHRDGWLKFIECGECEGCRFKCTCRNLKIKAYQ